MFCNLVDFNVVCVPFVSVIYLFSNIMASIDMLIFDIDRFYDIWWFFYILVQINLMIWHFEILIGRHLTYSRMPFVLRWFIS